MQEGFRFFSTSSYPCSYVEGQMARSQVASPLDEIDGENYSQLVQHGFRRGGLFVYRPHCDQCHACLSLRVLVASFQANRSQKRAQKMHAHLQTVETPLSFVEEHFHLYRKYQAHRHPQSSMNVDSIEQYQQFMLQSSVQSRLVEFRDSSTHELKMVSVVDILDDGISAVYTFYDPAPRNSLGTYSVLWQIQRTREMGLPHLYLGYWIPRNAKMGYKSRFHPHQILYRGCWSPEIELK